MKTKVGINGFGRIGRNAFKIAMEKDVNFEIAAINDLTTPATLAHLLKYDSCFGKFDGTVEATDNSIIVNGKEIKILAESDPKNLPWKEMGVEVVLESTGRFTKRPDAGKHLEAGAKKVVISAPATDEDLTIVMGVNEDKYDPANHHILSNASCTTNCLAPVCKVIEDNWGIEQGLMSTIHAATAKQKVVDARSLKDWRTGRSAFGNIIPTSTGAAKAVGLVIPSLVGRMTGIAYRVPTNDVSVIDVNIQLKESASYEEICRKIKEASEEGPMKGVIEYIDDEVVSSDFIADPHTSIFDAREGIQLNDKFFKLIAFYDNEYGYSTKVLELIRHMYHVDNADA